MDPIKLEPFPPQDFAPCDVEDGEIFADEPEQIFECTKNAIIAEDIANSEENYRKSNHRQNHSDKILYSRTLYIGDLPKKATTEKLSSIFEKYGKIIDIDIKFLKFGVTTYAFIQYIDPICSIFAHDNEQNCSIDGHALKVGFGRATPSDCLWFGGLSEKDLTKIGNMFRSFPGYKCALTDTHLLQTIVKFELIADCVVAYDHVFTLEKHPKLLVDFLSYHGTKKYIQRMLDSDQIVDESYLKFQIVYPDEHSGEVYKRKAYGKQDRHHKHDFPREQKTLDRSRSLSPLSVESPRRKRRIPSRITQSSDGSNDSKASKSSSTENISKTGHCRRKRGLISAKSSSHKIWSGNRRVFDACLCDITKGKEKICSLKIGQRMKLDDEQLSLISQRLKAFSTY
ncbi:hypothetical protein MXB_3824 [Myxobolus squamalis]|nr:hypothetical protein MXB_3824 [Myxobolus squamalis]